MKLQDPCPCGADNAGDCHRHDYSHSFPYARYHLKDHLVWSVALSQAEGGAEVSLEQRILLDRGEQSLVDLLLVLGPVAGNILLHWLLALGTLEELLLAALLVRLAVPGEVLGLAGLANGCLVEAVERHSCGGGDHVAGVDAAEWDAVELEGAGDEKDALWQDIEEDDTLAAETASEEDEDGARLEGCARLAWADGLAGL